MLWAGVAASAKAMSTQVDRRADLLLLRLAHPPKYPDDPSPVRHLSYETKLPLGIVRLAFPLTEEELEEPLCHVKQSQVVLFRDLRPLRFDVLQERG